MKKLLRLWLVCVFVPGLFAAPVALLAQDEPVGPVEFDLAVVISILATGIMGVPVSNLVEVIKRALKWDGFKAYVIVIVVSAAAVTAYLIPLGLFSMPLLIGYTVLVFGEASGLYKTIKKPNVV